jgi:hypothetical protein
MNHNGYTKGHQLGIATFNVPIFPAPAVTSVFLGPLSKKGRPILT